MAELFLLGKARGLLRMSPTSVQSRFILAQHQKRRQQQQQQQGTATKEASEHEGLEPVQKSESLAEATCRREATLGSMMDWAFGSDGPKTNSTWESSRDVVSPLQSSCVTPGDCGLIGSLGLPLLTGSHWPRYVYVDGKQWHLLAYPASA